LIAGNSTRSSSTVGASALAKARVACTGAFRNSFKEFLIRWVKVIAANLKKAGDSRATAHQG
jgi:hypothetical protein